MNEDNSTARAKAIKDAADAKYRDEMAAAADLQDAITTAKNKYREAIAAAEKRYLAATASQ